MSLSFVRAALARIKTTSPLTAAGRELLLRDDRIAHLEADNAELRRQLVTDPLTGLLNRLGGQRSLESFYNRCIHPWFRPADESGSAPPVLDPRCIVMAAIDLDHFKTINDTYGHDVGDEALVKVARDLQGLFRLPAEAVVVRQGGEEMYVAMIARRDDALTVGIEAAHWIRRSLAAHCHVGPALHQVTASIGIAWFTPDLNHVALTEGLQKIEQPVDRDPVRGFDRRRDAGLRALLDESEDGTDANPAYDLDAMPGFRETREAALALLFKQADDCVYAAKHAGRNRTFWWDYGAGRAEPSPLNPQRPALRAPARAVSMT